MAKVIRVLIALDSNDTLIGGLISCVKARDVLARAITTNMINGMTVRGIL